MINCWHKTRQWAAARNFAPGWICNSALHTFNQNPEATSQRPLPKVASHLEMVLVQICEAAIRNAHFDSKPSHLYAKLKTYTPQCITKPKTIQMRIGWL